MDYTATEIQLIKVIDKFILERYGKLLRVPSTRKDTIDGDFDLATEYGGIIFQYSDYYLGVDKGFFNSILGLFDMKPRNYSKNGFTIISLILQLYLPVGWVK